jgi:drug/metabolite transporter (DMT)-like permease
VGTVMLGCAGAPRIWNTVWSAISGEIYLIIIYLGFASTAFTFFLAKSASLVLSPTKVMAYTFLIPGLVAFLQGAFGQAWPEPSVFVGVAITTLAMLAMLKVE